MRKRDRKALGEYVRWVANEMELRDWTFEIMRDPCDEGKHAEVEIIFGRKRARIGFCPGFRTLPAEEQRQIVAHELVHCHLESACNMVQNDLEQWLGKQADQLFFDGYRRQIEYGVDALAEALAKHLPLVDWPER